MTAESRELEARPMTHGPNHHFFGYYDKFPWDSTGRYHVALETTFIDRPPTADDTATIGLIDTADGDSWKPLAVTHAWNWQQGTMLHWLPTAPDRWIIYNDREGDHFISVKLDVRTGEKRKLPRPIYAISRNGRQAVSLNFARVHRNRPGYGYAGAPDRWKDDPCPAEDGIYWMDLETGENRLIISLAQIVKVRHNETMDGVQHWFNHLQFNHDGTRFLFLHRWRSADQKRWYTQMFTANPDGTGIHCAADDGMTSHFDWRSSTQILAWARQKAIGDRFFLFTDKTNRCEVVGEGTLTMDGHCSYSPDGQWILNDTYPDRTDRKRTLMLFRPADGRRVDIGRFYAPPQLDGEIRCDLHPRWSRDGRSVSFDSVHEGHRQVYVIDVSEVVKE